MQIKTKLYFIQQFKIINRQLFKENLFKKNEININIYYNINLIILL
jgi:hypothetical protein